MSLVTPCLYFPFYAANVFLPVETVVCVCMRGCMCSRENFLCCEVSDTTLMI